MLVLSRKKGQSIKIGEEIIVEVLEIKGEGIKIGIFAPKNIAVIRSELIEEVKSENLSATRFNKETFSNLNDIFKDL